MCLCFHTEVQYIQKTPALVRPILPADRTVLDRLVEALVGDGPQNRYALICQHCQRHNGMALPEEFEYIGWSKFTTHISTDLVIL